MAPKFPAPLLSVTPDAVRHLEGDDALSRLWTLFTKCKESLQEGRRLENISWRLWYRELHRDEAQSSLALDPDWNEKHLSLNDERLYRPPTPDESLHLSPILPTMLPGTAPIGAHQGPDSLTTSPMTSLSASPSPSHLRPRRNSSIGQIICEMLPSLSISPASTTASVVPQAEITFAQPITRRCHLPTPDEQPSNTPLLQDAMAVPTIDLPDPDPPNTHLDPPRLVIVNPTPNPTPPPTPQIPPSSTPSPLAFDNAVRTSIHLLPPPMGGVGLGRTMTRKEQIVSPPSVAVEPPTPQLERPVVDLTSPPVRVVSLDDDPGGGVVEDTRLSGGRLLGSISEVQIKQDASAEHEVSPSPTASSFSQSPTTHGSAPSPTKSTSQAQKKPNPTGRLMRSISSGSGRAAGGKKTRAATSRSLSRTRSLGSKAGEAENATAAKEPPVKRDESSRTKVTAGPARKIVGAGSGKRPVAVGRTLHVAAVRKGVGGAAKERERSKERNQVEVEVIADVIRSERNAGKVGTKAKGSEPADKNKRPRFNIGSHSDGGGSGSKSAGSASSGSALEAGANHPAAPLVPTQPGSHPSTQPNQATQILPSHPALPQRRTTIVIATSDSDYETETETDENSGEWSEESASVAVAAPAPAARPQHQHQPPVRHPSQHTAAGQQHPNRHPQRQTVPEIPIEQAVLEAQRRRELFTKKPTTSTTSLGGVERTQSVGLLTRLMNPDPEIFPIGHPYRRGFSSGEIRGPGPRPPSGVSKPPIPNANAPPPPTGVAVNGKVSQPPAKPVQSSQGRPYRPGGLQVRKSSAAVPLASQIQIGSANGYTSNVVPAVTHNSGGYRPKGRPDDQEMEDDSDSDDDAGDASKNGGIVGRFTNSVAEERLKALVQLRGKGRTVSGPTSGNPRPNPRDEDDHEVPGWVRQERPQPTTSNASRYTQQHRKPAPIPLGHPYNLPPPAAPSTPRTTRRLMLQTEMSESLRRNLLWERQVSKVNLVGFRRAATGDNAGAADGAESRNGVNGAGDPQRRRSLLAAAGAIPAVPSMVQLTAKTGDGEEREQDRERKAVNKGTTDELKRQAIARNRSWADDYHTRGW